MFGKDKGHQQENVLLLYHICICIYTSLHSNPQPLDSNLKTAKREPPVHKVGENACTKLAFGNEIQNNLQFVSNTILSDVKNSPPYHKSLN